jgi:anti-sigma B factor antagonist
MPDNDTSVKEIRNVDDATVVVLTGDIDLHHVPQVHAALLEILEKHPKRLVIDLAEVGYMDSSGVGVLVHAFQKMKTNRGELRLVAMQQRVRSIFEITKLDKYFVICDSEEEALKA